MIDAIKDFFGFSTVMNISIIGIYFIYALLNLYSLYKSKLTIDAKTKISMYHIGVMLSALFYSLFFLTGFVVTVILTVVFSNRRNGLSDFLVNRKTKRFIKDLYNLYFENQHIHSENMELHYQYSLLTFLIPKNKEIRNWKKKLKKQLAKYPQSLVLDVIKTTILTEIIAGIIYYLSNPGISSSIIIVWIIKVVIIVVYNAKASKEFFPEFASLVMGEQIYLRNKYKSSEYLI